MMIKPNSALPTLRVLPTRIMLITQTATSPVEQYTNQLFIRLRGRAFSVRMESNMTDTAWRLGVPRIEIKRDGRK